jgi:hypothetical protein
MNFHHKRHLIKFITIALITSLTTGCTVWTSVPETVDQHYGDAVRNMIINQTLYNEQTDNDIPLLNMDGEKETGKKKNYLLRYISAVIVLLIIIAAFIIFSHKTAPQRINIEIGDSPILGESNAKVTIIEFSDLNS